MDHPVYTELGGAMCTGCTDFATVDFLPSKRARHASVFSIYIETTSMHPTW
jgi:hypothetical protein